MARNETVMCGGVELGSDYVSEYESMLAEALPVLKLETEWTDSQGGVRVVKKGGWNQLLTFVVYAQLDGETWSEQGEYDSLESAIANTIANLF